MLQRNTTAVSGQQCQRRAGQAHLTCPSSLPLILPSHAGQALLVKPKRSYRGQPPHQNQPRQKPSRQITPFLMKALFQEDWHLKAASKQVEQNLLLICTQRPRAREACRNNPASKHSVGQFFCHLIKNSYVRTHKMNNLRFFQSLPQP